MITTLLGGPDRLPVTIHCPQRGDVDPFDDVPLIDRTVMVLGLDVETNGRTDPYGAGFDVRTVQLAPDNQTAWVFRMDDLAQREAVRAILTNPGARFISHTKIDVHALHTALGVTLDDHQVLDSHPLAVMASPDDREGQAELKPVAERFGMPELAEAERVLIARMVVLYREAHPEIGRRAIAAKKLKAWGFANVPLDDVAFLTYAGLDAIVARRLVPLLVTASQAPAHVLRAEQRLTGLAVRLERRGHLVDRERLASTTREVEATEADVTERLAELTGGLKPTQGVALQRWLGEHGVDWEAWPGTMRTKTGGPSLAGDNVYYLQRIALGTGSPPVIEQMIRHHEIADALTRVHQIRDALDPHGRTHGTLRTVGTVTSRMSGAGPNMQNFKKKTQDANGIEIPGMRGLYVFEPGYVGITCDFAQIELRVTAALTGEKSMIDVIMSGGDLHDLTAEKLTIDRQPAKTVNFLVLYGGGAAKLAGQLKHTVSVDECRVMLRDYWDGYPAIKAMKDSLQYEHEIRLISGRRVPIGTRSHAAMNYLIQGSARELLVGAWLRFQAACRARGLDAEVWFPIHDELVVQAREDQAEEVAALLTECMTFDFYGVPVQADADLLIDRDGTSRWMSGDCAKAIRLERAA